MLESYSYDAEVKVKRAGQTKLVKKRFTIPHGLKTLLEEMAREILRHNPQNVPLHLAEYLEGRLAQRKADYMLTGKEDGEGYFDNFGNREFSKDGAPGGTTSGFLQQLEGTKDGQQIPFSSDDKLVAIRQSGQLYADGLGPGGAGQGQGINPFTGLPGESQEGQVRLGGDGSGGQFQKRFTYKYGGREGATGPYGPYDSLIDKEVDVVLGSIPEQIDNLVQEVAAAVDLTRDIKPSTPKFELEEPGYQSVPYSSSRGPGNQMASGVGSQQPVAQMASGVGSRQPIPQMASGPGSQQPIPQMASGAGSRQPIPQMASGPGSQQSIPKMASGMGSQQPVSNMGSNAGAGGPRATVQDKVDVINRAIELVDVLENLETAASLSGQPGGAGVPGSSYGVGSGGPTSRLASGAINAPGAGSAVNQPGINSSGAPIQQLSYVASSNMTEFPVTSTTSATFTEMIRRAIENMLQKLILALSGGTESQTTANIEATNAQIQQLQQQQRDLFDYFDESTGMTRFDSQNPSAASASMAPSTRINPINFAASNATETTLGNYPNLPPGSGVALAGSSVQHMYERGGGGLGSNFASNTMFGSQTAAGGVVSTGGATAGGPGGPVGSNVRNTVGVPGGAVGSNIRNTAGGPGGAVGSSVRNTAGGPGGVPLTNGGGRLLPLKGLGAWMRENNVQQIDHMNLGQYVEGMVQRATQLVDLSKQAYDQNPSGRKNIYYIDNPVKVATMDADGVELVKRATAVDLLNTTTRLLSTIDTSSVDRESGMAVDDESVSALMEVTRKMLEALQAHIARGEEEGENPLALEALRMGAESLEVAMILLRDSMGPNAKKGSGASNKSAGSNKSGPGNMSGGQIPGMASGTGIPFPPGTKSQRANSNTSNKSRKGSKKSITKITVTDGDGTNLKLSRSGKHFLTPDGRQVPLQQTPSGSFITPNGLRVIFDQDGKIISVDDSGTLKLSPSGKHLIGPDGKEVPMKRTKSGYSVTPSGVRVQIDPSGRITGVASAAVPSYLNKGGASVSGQNGAGQNSVPSAGASRSSPNVPSNQAQPSGANAQAQAQGQAQPGTSKAAAAAAASNSQGVLMVGHAALTDNPTAPSAWALGMEGADGDVNSILFPGNGLEFAPSGMGEWVAAVKDFMSNQIHIIRQLLTGQLGLAEARGQIIFLSIAFVVGIVVGFAVVRSLTGIGGDGGTGQCSVNPPATFAQSSFFPIPFLNEGDLNQMLIDLGIFSEEQP